jgi:hypothetical protein
LDCRKPFLEYFLGKSWRAITYDKYYLYDEDLYVLSPSAYAYYLPGLLSTIVKEKAFDSYLINSITYYFKDFDQETSDQHCLKRWTILTIDEYLVIKDWLKWISKDNIYEDKDITNLLLT